MSDVPAPAGSPYDEWGRLTRFFQSARIAFARERDMWASRSIDAAERVRISSPEASYTVALQKHINAIDDAEMLHGFVLVHSYALAESAAADRLTVPPRSLGGIEDWGAQLLSTNDRDWTDVEGGLGGAVEVAITRNAIAHGSRTIDAAARERLLKAGARVMPVGTVVTLTYTELNEFRGRLLSLMNESGIGR
ncbi:MAG TPA: hypothetical protein VFX51_21315 [Solirubrobacteraceae bacterium]|nr:hypothetical protein [Solirubrobacteraceae bacterium]